MKVMWRLDIPESLRKEVEESYSTESEKNHAYADNYNIYVNPRASWKDLTLTLYDKNEFTALRESKSFMSTGKYCYSYKDTHNTHELMQGSCSTDLKSAVN